MKPKHHRKGGLAGGWKVEPSGELKPIMGCKTTELGSNQEFEIDSRVRTVGNLSHRAGTHIDCPNVSRPRRARQRHRQQSAVAGEGEAFDKLSWELRHGFLFGGAKVVER